jgi:hypothetical protein
VKREAWEEVVLIKRMERGWTEDGSVDDGRAPA